MNKLLLIILAGLIPITSSSLIARNSTETKNVVKINKANQVKSKQITKSMSTKFEFKALPYAYDALEPYIDKMTMEIHYSKHHRAYFDNFIKSIEGTEAANMDIYEIFKNISKLPVAVRNNAGGYFNHELYWNIMGLNGSKPSSKLQAAIDKKFGSMDELKKQFGDAGKSRFGSGWAWLSIDNSGELFISSTPNQDNPIMDIADKQGIPILCMDVWEHAYYLKYQNRRPDYVEAFWNVINWQEVSERYEKALKNN